MFKIKDNARIAMVSLPWQDPEIVNLQIASLKSFLSSRGWCADALHIYKDIYAYLDIETYKLITELLIGEHLFAALYFSDANSAIIKSLEDRVKDYPINIQQVLDALQRLVEDAVSEIGDSHYELVGFTTTHLQTMASLCVARELKQRFANTPYVTPYVTLGGLALQGPLALSICKQFSEVDFVITGDGEFSLNSLLEKLATGADLSTSPNLVYRQNGVVLQSPVFSEAYSLDDLPAPDYADFFSRRCANGDELHPKLNIETVRGCRWGRCTFCIESTLPRSRGGTRKKSVNNVLAEIESLMEKHRITDFVFSDADASGRSDVFKALAEAPYDVSISAEVAGFITRDKLINMKNGGISSLQIGIESFSENVLNKFEKGVPLINYVYFMKLCKELNLELTYNVIVDTPFETQYDVDIAAQNMRALSLFTPPRLSKFVVSYRSAIEATPSQFGIKRLRVSEDLAGYPEAISDSIGPLISYHGGHSWDGVANCNADYSDFNRALDEWNVVAELERELVARRGIGFTELIWRIGDVEKHIHLSEALDCAVYEFCCQKPRKINDIYTHLPAWTAEQIDESLSEFVSAGLMFSSENKYLGFATYRQRNSSKESKLDSQLFAHNDKSSADRVAIPIVPV